MDAQRVVFLLCQAVMQPPEYTELIGLIDFDKWGGYTWSRFNPETSEWSIPLKDGSIWTLTLRRENGI